MRTRRVVSALLTSFVLVGLSACTVQQGEDEATGGNDEQSAAVRAAGRDVRLLPSELRQVIKDVASTHGKPDARVPRFGAPIFEPGNAEPTFYEVDLAPGWAVVSAGEHPEVLEMSATGDGPTARLTKGTAGAKRIVRLDTALYVATSEAGRALGQNAASIVKIDRSHGTAEEKEVSAEDALNDFTTARAERDQRAGEAGEAGEGALAPQWLWNDDPPPNKECRVRGEVPSYSQLDPHESPNTGSCASGCGPTAWATIFGWASMQAAENEGDASYAGLFRAGAQESGATRVAPLRMDSDVAELSWQLHEKLNTFCVGRSGATATFSMNNARDFIKNRAPGVKINSRGNEMMISRDSYRDEVIDALCDGRPSIVGTGSLFRGDGHYPIAKAYKDGMFELEMGWGGNGNGWYKASTWYVGNVQRSQ